MPYIKKEDRARLDDLACAIDNTEIKSPGELNYLITLLTKQYHFYFGKPCYQSYNDVIGALECAKLEAYRRQIAPYEDKKIEENGDV